MCYFPGFFKELNYQNLLYLQAEIVHLEEDLQSISQRDAQHEDREYFARDWWQLSKQGLPEEAEQWEKFLEIREKLDIYSTAGVFYALKAGF
jgi:hypothetical protein